MSIATMHGDGGQTGLAGGFRLSKADLRVEAYGAVDELNAVLGFARSLCPDASIRGWTEEIQKTLFRVGAALANPVEGEKRKLAVTVDDVDGLTTRVHALESTEGLLADWSLPGAMPESSAFEMARTVCRRAERAAVRFAETGAVVDAPVLAYLNRLSDLIWLFGRLLEHQAGIDSSLRDEGKGGPRWSRAW